MSESHSTQEIDVLRHDQDSEQSAAQDSHVAIHTDTYDIDEDALGTNLPKHYYLSPGFIGTVTVCCQTSDHASC